MKSERKNTLNLLLDSMTNTIDTISNMTRKFIFLALFYSFLNIFFKTNTKFKRGKNMRCFQKFVMIHIFSSIRLVVKNECEKRFKHIILIKDNVLKKDSLILLN